MALFLRWSIKSSKNHKILITEMWAVKREKEKKWDGAPRGREVRDGSWEGGN